MINFSRSFDLAWERMVVILFRPFDLGKWLAIGFSAFLAGLLAGGNGINGSYKRGDLPVSSHTGWSYSSPFHSYNFDASAGNFFHGPQSAFIIACIIFGFLFGLVIVVLLYWLGTRGQFLLLDNVVRNRGAIVWPWKAYARAGNSLFRFYLCILLLSLVILIPFAIVGVMMAMPFFHQHRFPMAAEIFPFAGFGLVSFVVVGIWAIVLFLFRELAPPLMFRHGLSAWEAGGRVWALVRLHPGSMVLFVLLRLALFIALVVVSFVLCCATCCIEAIPYLGTVVLLPAILFIKCFTLDFLAQFGPEYDVWITDVPAEVAPVTTAAVLPPDPTPPPPPV